MLNGKILNTFSLKEKDWEKARMNALTTSIQQYTDGSSRCNKAKQTKRKTCIQIER